MKAPSIKELRKELKKDYPDHHSFYAKIFIRKISLYVTWLFLHTSITANQVTILSTIIAVFGSFFFLHNDPIYWVWAWIFLQIFRVLDGVDGEIARYRKNETKLGKRLEGISHKIIDFSVFSCIAFGVYFIFNEILILALGILATLSKLAFGIMTSKKKQKKIKRGGNIILRISHEIGSFFQFTIVPGLLDILTGSSYYRLLFVIIMGVIFPLVFVKRFYSALKN